MTLTPTVPTPVYWALDTETGLIEPGLNAPFLACISVSRVLIPEPPTFAGEADARTRGAEMVAQVTAAYHTPTLESHAALYHWTQGEALFRQLFEGTGAHIVGANIAYDLRALAQRFPMLLALIFDMLSEGRVHDTQTGEKILDIARGTLAKNPRPPYQRIRYSLDDQYNRITGRRLDKDTWRLRYGELAPYPLEYWPEGARTYASQDASVTAMVWSNLMIRAGVQRVAQANVGVVHSLTLNEPEQARSFFALGVASCWGLITNGESVSVLETRTTEVFDRYEAELAGHGLIDGGAATRTIKKVKHKYRKPYAFGSDKNTRNTEAARERLLIAAREQYPGTPDELLPIERSDTTNDAALSADACAASTDPIVRLYGKLGGVSAILAKDIPALRSGTLTPIHTRFDLAASGRSTSSQPNVQNWATKIPGVRECFEPRPGMLYASADVGGLELATLAETCLKLFGWSSLADAILAGRDPHCDLACRILGIDPALGAARHKAGKENDKEFYMARQTAKVLNFGFPGGLGAASLVAYARALYGVILTEEDARALKQLWLDTWPEMRLFFRYVGQLTEQGLVVEQVGSGRYRGGCTYTSACNTFFQGLGADAMKHVAWELTRACYDPRVGSILLGSRIVNFIHDEFIIEVIKDASAHLKAEALGALMNLHIARYLPNVTPKAEPLLMAIWSKDAKPVRDASSGQLIPWKPKVTA